MTERRKISIHVGQTKAGSTSFQNYMDSQYDALAAQGVLFPRSILTRRNAYDPTRTPGHLDLLRRLNRGKLAEFERELAEHPAARVVLSIENLFSDKSDVMISRLGAYFHAWDVEIIAVLRPQLDWLRSRYVENVLSGFHCSTDGFVTWVRKAWDSGVLDYRTRLSHLAGLLGADRVSAIRFDDPVRPLMPRWLDAMDLPLTDPNLIHEVHANRRGKNPALLEAKRRLNSLTTALTLDERLRLEAELRAAARSGATACDSGAGMLDQIALDPVQLAALRAGNDALLADGILDQSLDVGALGVPPPPPAAEQRNAVDVLIAKGLKLATEIAWQAEPSRFAASILRLTHAQVDTLACAFARHPVSLHLNAPETAALATCHEGRLVSLLLPAPTPWQLLARLDGTETVSPLIALAVPEGVSDGIIQYLDDHRLPRAGLVVVGAGYDPEMLSAILEQGAPDEVIILDTDHFFRSDISKQGWSGQTVGDILLLQRQNVTNQESRTRSRIYDGFADHTGQNESA